MRSAEYSQLYKQSEKQYKDRIERLYTLKMISDTKRKNLLLESESERASFISQNLVDTRYIIREFSSILKAYHEVKNDDVHICNLKACVIDSIKKALDYQKVREVGDQHHAYDAVYSCIVDKVLSVIWPNYDQRSNVDKKGNVRKFKCTIKGEDKELTLSELSNAINQEQRDQKKDVIRYLTRSGFKKAYNQDVSGSKFLEKIHETTPLISWKVEKNWGGKYCDATIYKPKKQESKVSALDVLGINNEKRTFDSVYCYAFDVYKVGTKHFIIHIPYAIVDHKTGAINKQKYIKLLVKFHENEKLIKDGEVDISKFLFRVNVNDLMYDTDYNEVYRVNATGSIALSKLEIKSLQTFSYSSVYNKGLRQYLYNEKRLNLKTKNNTDGIPFTDYLNSEEDYIFLNELTASFLFFDKQDLKRKNILKSYWILLYLRKKI